MSRPVVAVTQRVAVAEPHGERRDALDQRWAHVVQAAGLDPVPIPATIDDPIGWLDRLGVSGALLTGGNDPTAVGGDAPERDALETALLSWATARGRPLLGVCRGMQMIQLHFGVELVAVDGHVATTHELVVDGSPRTVNSFHGWGATGSVAELRVVARAADGVVEAVRHVDHPIVGIMWHPEREATLDPADVELMRHHFRVGVSRVAG